MMRKLVPIIIFVIAITAARGVYAKNKLNILRVRVAKNKTQIKLKITSSYIIQTLYTGEVLEKSKKSLKTKIVVPTQSGLKIGKKAFSLFAIRIIPGKDANIYIDRRRFRGIIDIIRTKQMTLLVINHIDVEDYLYGVLYYETPHYWPMETLMAQAIAARTYALYQKKERKGFDYDLTNDTFTQMYGGKAGERWRTRRAVNLTKGKVLTYKGKIFPAYYSSICGGHTEDASKLWKIDIPPLKGRPCKYCRHSPGYSWKAMYSYKQIEERLNKYGIESKNLSYIVEGKRDKSGRLETVRIKDDKGVKNIPANLFRLALGSSMMRSTKFSIEITKKGIIFRGKGWGHGVGMCQWGAFNLARRGYDHKEILEFYYPTSKISNN